MSAEGNPTVVIGIPTMNNEDTIERTLDGIVSQSRPPDEIIIVDASTDTTPERIRSFADQVDVSISLHEQRDEYDGVGGARQQIYERFDGDILVSIDTDSEPGHANWLSGHIKTHDAHPECGIVSGVPNTGVQDYVRTPHDRRYFVQNNSSVKAEALDAVNGWDARMTRGEDWDMAIRLWRAGVKSLARGGLGTEFFTGDNIPAMIRKRLHRPSSVRFLRKYGSWYVRFHPTHVLGDLVSAISLIILVLSPLLVLYNPLAPVLLLFPVIGLVAHLTVSRWTARISIPWGPFLTRTTPEFFLLGYTAGREVLFGPKSGWNYGGIN